MRKLCSIDHLHTIIEQECARVDRNGHEFSLVVFEVAKKITNHTIEQRLVKVLTPRVRFTDTVGLLDGHRLGVVLPYTSATGAKRLANDVRQSISISALPIHCEVYTYPSHWLPRDKGNSRRNWYSDVLKKQDKAILRGLSPSTGGVSPDRQSTEYQTKTGMSSARGLDPLPVRRIPIWKRTLDIIGALLGFIVFSPLLLLIVLIIKFVSSGPILFKQIRVGYLGRMFNLLKFRTMKVSADVELHQQRLNELINSEQPMTKLDMEYDPRIIPFGKILRITGLDELPQLLNVLRGEMSLVGPRPCIPYEVDEYLSWQTGRFDALPGITGLWQVSGKNRTSFKEMVALDIRYARHISFWLDIKILVMTLPAIMTQIYDILMSDVGAKR